MYAAPATEPLRGNRVPSGLNMSHPETCLIQARPNCRVRFPQMLNLFDSKHGIVSEYSFREGQQADDGN
jgi:hypothetical protein